MSVINKMLNDLDGRDEDEQAKPEVAFLEKQIQEKPKRSKKWWFGVISSTLTVVLAIAVGSIYYNRVNDMFDSLQVAKQTSQSASPSTNQGNPPNTENTNAAQQQDLQMQQQTNADDKIKTQPAAPVDQPKLVVLKPLDENSEKVERQSTLSLSTQPANEANRSTATQSDGATNSQSVNNQSNETQINNSQSNKAQTSTSQVDNGQRNSSDGQIANNLRDGSSRNSESNQATAAVLTTADLPKPQGAPEADENQMSISAVNLTAAQRAQKLFDQGLKLAQDGMIEPALEKYRQVLQFSPTHEKARVEMAGLYYGRNMISDALEVLSQGLNIEPGNRHWSLVAAKIHFKRDNFAAALAYLQLPVHALDDVEYVALKGGVFQKLKDYSQAAKVFAQLSSSYPSNGRWWLGLATALEGKQDYPGAVDAYRRSLQLSNVSRSSRQFILQRLQLLEN